VRDVPGKPALFATTRSFLEYFNLDGLSQLPSLQAIRDMDTIAAELNMKLPLDEVRKDATDNDSEQQADDENEELNQQQDLLVNADAANDQKNTEPSSDSVKEPQVNQPEDGQAQEDQSQKNKPGQVNSTEEQS